MAQPHDEAVVGLGRDLEHVGHGVARDDERVVARSGERLGRPANTPPRRGDLEVLPCITCGARTTWPPKTWPMHWWPRHTPSTGTPRSPKSRIASFDTPASSGGRAPGPVTSARVGLERADSSRLTASWRWTTGRHRAPPGTARGCRRTSRSCRSRARAAPRPTVPAGDRTRCRRNLPRCRSRRASDPATRRPPPRSGRRASSGCRHDVHLPRPSASW